MKLNAKIVDILEKQHIPHQKLADLETSDNRFLQVPNVEVET